MKTFVLSISSLTLSLVPLLTSCNSKSENTEQQNQLISPSRQDIVNHYAKLVHITYQDCLKTSLELQIAINDFLEQPNEETLRDAKSAWLTARQPYGQSEAFRFYGGPIDDEDGPEGFLNAWPLDESYIEANGSLKGIIQNLEKHPHISRDLLTRLNEKEGEENISTGFHAIEFLLWGIDNNATGPGNRPVSDFTTAPFADRRKIYLKAVTELLVSDLQSLEQAWQPAQENYRASFIKLETTHALQHILNGIGMLSGFELARERIDVPLHSMSQEDEHSCFSDNTHNDIIYNALSIQNAFNGSYKGVHFNLENGPSVSSLFKNEVNLTDLIATNVKKSHALQPPFDQLILEGNEEGRSSLKDLVSSLSKQARDISEACSVIGIQINIEE